MVSQFLAIPTTCHHVTDRDIFFYQNLFWPKINIIWNVKRLNSIYASYTFLRVLVNMKIDEYASDDLKKPTFKVENIIAL
jgi:hypothetical protein